jgi:hypothetical protein
VTSTSRSDGAGEVEKCIPKQCFGSPKHVRASDVRNCSRAQVYGLTCSVPITPISMRSYPHDEPDEVADHPDNYGLRVLGLGCRITGAPGITRTVVHQAQPARLVSVEA